MNSQLLSLALLLLLFLHSDLIRLNQVQVLRKFVPLEQLPRNIARYEYIAIQIVVTVNDWRGMVRFVGLNKLHVFNSLCLLAFHDLPLVQFAVIATGHQYLFVGLFQFDQTGAVSVESIAESLFIGIVLED